VICCWSILFVWHVCSKKNHSYDLLFRRECVVFILFSRMAVLICLHLKSFCPRYNQSSIFNSFKRTKVKPSEVLALRSDSALDCHCIADRHQIRSLIPLFLVSDHLLHPYFLPSPSTFHVAPPRRAILPRWILSIEQLQYGVNQPLPSPSTLIPKPKRTSIAMVYGQSTMAQKEYPPEPHRGMFWVELIE